MLDCCTSPESKQSMGKTLQKRTARIWKETTYGGLWRQRGNRRSSQSREHWKALWTFKMFLKIYLRRQYKGQGEGEGDKEGERKVQFPKYLQQPGAENATPGLLCTG